MKLLLCSDVFQCYAYVVPLKKAAESHMKIGVKVASGYQYTLHTNKTEPFRYRWCVKNQHTCLIRREGAYWKV